MKFRLIFLITLIKLSQLHLVESYDQKFNQNTTKVIVKLHDNEDMNVEEFLKNETLTSSEFEIFINELKNKKSEEEQIKLLKRCNSSDNCLKLNSDIVENIRGGNSSKENLFEAQIKQLMIKSDEWSIDLLKKMRAKLLGKIYKFHKSNNETPDPKIIDILNEDSKGMENLYLNDTEVVDVLETYNLTEKAVLEMKYKLMRQYGNEIDNSTNENTLKISHSDSDSLKAFQNKFNQFSKITRKAKLSNDNIEIMKLSGLPIEVLRSIKEDIFEEHKRILKERRQRRKNLKKVKMTSTSPDVDYEEI